jgi:serine/threonine-protein kinase
MGVIFRARHEPLNRTVALKLILSGSLATADDVARFRAEAEMVAGLDHPGIVHVYEVGSVRGIFFFSMTYLPAGTLSDRVRGGPLEPRKAAECVRRIAEAMAYAHEQGVVHRDLKPSNILFDAQGDPKITDFGLAKRRDASLHLTMTGQILGTPAYMAPEQAAGQQEDFSPQLDVYAIGAILYHLLTGRAPFRASNPIDIMLQVLDRDPDPVSQHNRQVPLALQRICQRAMEKRPSRRYASTVELARDLQSFLKDEPIRWPQETWLHGFQRWWRHEPILLAHWYGIAATLGISWSHYAVKHTDLSYVVHHSLTLLLWAAISWFLQKWMHRPQWRETACLTWGTFDVVLFTYVLHGVSPPRESLLVGYALLIVSSGLFLRVRYVTIMTILVLAGFSVLVTLAPTEFLEKPHHTAIFVACLGVIGMVVGALVRRVRALREYYEEEC